MGGIKVKGLQHHRWLKMERTSTDHFKHSLYKLSGEKFEILNGRSSQVTTGTCILVAYFVKQIEATVSPLHKVLRFT